MERSTFIHRNLRQIYIQKQNRGSCFIVKKLIVSQYSLFSVHSLTEGLFSPVSLFLEFLVVHYFVKLDFEIDFKRYF